MNVIFNSNSSSAESNLDINDTYDLVNDDSNITDFGKNYTYDPVNDDFNFTNFRENSKVVLSLNESWSRR
jgi:hypothetical protein